MDAFLTTVVAGVIVAVVSAVAAFYFGRLQEKQKQEYERKEEEERRLEERQNREEEQKKQGAVALGQIEAQASMIVEDVISWVENAAGLPESVPYGGLLPDAHRLTREWRELLEKYAEVVQQRDSIATKMDSLRLYYREQALSLPITARNVFESFDKEFRDRYNPLSAQLQDYPSFERRFTFKEELSGAQKRTYTVFQILSAGSAGALLRSPRGKDLKEEWAAVPEAARYARDWDFGAHQVAFKKEIRKLTSTTS